MSNYSGQLPEEGEGGGELFLQHLKNCNMQTEFGVRR